MENLQNLFSIEMLLSTIRMAIPLALAAVGATICERSGVINLGIEGMMLFGAFSGVLGVYLTGNPWMGVLFAMVVGCAIGLVFGVLCLYFRANQSVTGVGLNILAAGLTVVLTRAIWSSDGLSGTVQQLPSVTIPLVSRIPVVGALFQNQSPFFFFTILVVVAAWLVMYRSKQGLRLRAIGDHPQAAASVGVPVARYRYAAVAVCGMLCSLAGAYLSIVQNSMFVNNMVAGRGFMALAANIFGGWNPLGSALASLMFAFAQALRIILDIDIPSQFVQMMPYLLTLLVLAGVGRRMKGPAAAGQIGDQG